MKILSSINCADIAMIRDAFMVNNKSEPISLCDEVICEAVCSAVWCEEAMCDKVCDRICDGVCEVICDAIDTYSEKSTNDQICEIYNGAGTC